MYQFVHERNVKARFDEERMSGWCLVACGWMDSDPGGRPFVGACKLEKSLVHHSRTSTAHALPGIEHRH
jgi:hypothetical protein